jgi:hypothetical protein
VVERGGGISEGTLERTSGGDSRDGVLQITCESQYQRVSPYFISAISLLIFCRRTLAAAVLTWSNLNDTNIGQRDSTASAETARRHALEHQKRDLVAVQQLEDKLNIAQRWERGSFEWMAAAEKVLMRTYQRCIDVLEGLIVARMFELTKMNRSQTGRILVSTR